MAVNHRQLSKGAVFSLKSSQSKWWIQRYWEADTFGFSHHHHHHHISRCHSTTGWRPRHVFSSIFCPLYVRYVLTGVPQYLSILSWHLLYGLPWLLFPVRGFSLASVASHKLPDRDCNTTINRFRYFRSWFTFWVYSHSLSQRGLLWVATENCPFHLKMNKNV